MTRPRITSLNVETHSFVVNIIFYHYDVRPDRDGAHLSPDWKRIWDVHQPRDQRLPGLQEHQGQSIIMIIIVIWIIIMMSIISRPCSVRRWRMTRGGSSTGSWSPSSWLSRCPGTGCWAGLPASASPRSPSCCGAWRPSRRTGASSSSRRWGNVLMKMCLWRLLICVEI